MNETYRQHETGYQNQNREYNKTMSMIRSTE